MPLYEHVFLARQDVSQAQVDAMVKEFADVITQGGGKVTKTEYWGLKNLAFKIKKSRKAHFTMFNIDSPPAAVAEMERRMGIASDILRFLTVRVEALETEPSVMMRKQDREERSERGGFGGGFGGGGRGGFGGGRGGPREGGGFRGGPREGGGGFRGGREGGDGGSTFRSRPPREGGEGGPRGPRPPRNDNPGSEG